MIESSASFIASHEGGAFQEHFTGSRSVIPTNQFILPVICGSNKEAIRTKGSSLLLVSLRSLMCQDVRSLLSLSL